MNSSQLRLSYSPEIDRTLIERCCPWGVSATAVVTGLAGFAIILIIDGVSVVITPQYNPLQDDISYVGVGPLGWLQTTGFCLLSAMIGLVASSLWRVSHRGALFRVAAAVAYLVAFCFVLVGVFHSNPGFSPRTPLELVHSISARVIAVAFPVVCLLVAAEIRGFPESRGFFWHSVVAGTGGLALALLLGTAALPGIERWTWYGFGERLLLINGVTWFLAIAPWLWRTSGYEIPGGFAPSTSTMSRGPSMSPDSSASADSTKIACSPRASLK